MRPLSSKSQVPRQWTLIMLTPSVGRWMKMYCLLSSAIIQINPIRNLSSPAFVPFISINTTVRYARPGAASYGRLAWWITWRQYLRRDVILTQSWSRLLQSSPSRRRQSSFRSPSRHETNTTDWCAGMTSVFVGFNFVGVIKPCVPSRPACLPTHGHRARRNRVTSSWRISGSQFR